MSRPTRSALALSAAVVFSASLTACGESQESSQDAPDSHREAEAARWAERELSDMSLADKVGQLFVHYSYGETADTQDPEDVKRNQDLHGVDNAKQLLEKYNLGGMIYFGWSDNLDDPEQIAKLSNDIQDVSLDQELKLPLLVSTDQEQGTVTRIGSPATGFPGNMALGASRDTDAAATAAEVTGRELRAMGINQDFAPVADVNLNPENPVIGVRSFGSDPQLVSEFTEAQVDGYQAGKDSVSATTKHFPGHGDTNLDSHTDLPEIDHSKKEWAKWDAPPFETAIDADVDSVMSAHIQFPALDSSGDPATLSKPILTDLLRKKLGFDGTIVTDSLSMQGVRELYSDAEIPVKALQAGADQLVMPADLELAIDSVIKAVKDGELTEKRIDASAARILELKYKRGVIDDPHVEPGDLDSVVGTPEHDKASKAVSDKTTTLVKNDSDVLPLPGKSAPFVAGPGSDVTGPLAEGLGGSAFETGENPDQATIDSAVDAAGDSDVAVVATSDAGQNPGQAKLVKALRDSGKHVVAVGVAEPYDINQFPGVDTYVATYSSAKSALDAAARAIKGDANPSGKLPVSIPDADDPDKKLYDFGHGLSYK